MQGVLGAVLLAGACCARTPPHIVMILGDDVGYYNMGFTEGNPEAYTPNMDALASQGVQLKRHYVYKYCSPTRSSLMTGRLPIHVNQENPSVNSVGGGVDLRMTMMPAKLRAAGYATHHVGKWHLGQTFIENVPASRGFDTSLGYLGGSEDHFTQRVSAGVDLFEQLQPAYGKNGTYGADMYTEAMVRLIKEHDQDKPFFLYAAFQNTHFPYEVPDSYLNASIPEERRTYQAIARVLDESVGNVTRALQDTGMWNNTLVVFSADNGGASALEHCASNNYPLRGSKHTDFEGGIRAGAFVAGGVLPDAVRGTQLEGYISVADWYATFAGLAGVHPKDPADGVPDTDSMDVWPMLSGANLTSPRFEIPLAVAKPGSNKFSTGQGLIQGEWKYITGNLDTGIRMSPQYPNASTVCDDFHDPGCPSGCLFNIVDDPTELVDLSSAHPHVVSAMEARLQELAHTVFQTSVPPGFSADDHCLNTSEVVDAHRGFVYPRCTLVGVSG
eukprot:TRINITY_DN2686_c3_g1_i1.p2 TRINITY_DN2686_c3_g1~~TRINITY_DN2686_c3_g1_i1.p2  ORF type:complete len:500 (+),score=185.00 TRINITY_DN2686_c3_g1_i1:60-1559(+)